MSGAPPSMVVSFFYACCAFQKAGIRNVRLPLFMPWQMHPDPSIDTRIENNKAALLRALRKHAPRIHIDPGVAPDGYQRLCLPEPEYPLHSDHPLLGGNGVAGVPKRGLPIAGSSPPLVL